MSLAYICLAAYDVLVRLELSRAEAPLPLPIFLLVRQVGCALLVLPCALGLEGCAAVERPWRALRSDDEIRSGHRPGFSGRVLVRQAATGLLGVGVGQIVYAGAVMLAGATEAATIKVNC